MNISLYMPVRLLTGKGCVMAAAPHLAALGSSCLIVTGGTSARVSGAIDDVTSVLESVGTKYVIFDKIRQNPTVQSCLEAAKLAQESGAEYIVGIGGGSPLDAAKAVAVVAANPGMDEKSLYSLKWENAPLPTVAVGTTAGTGSEVTPVSVLTNSAGLKKSIRDDRLYPVLALGDAAYTSTMPESVTLSTAVDALAHCTESYFNRAANDISRLYALKGTSVLLDVFKKISSSGVSSLNHDEREELYNGSIYGGLAISVTGTAFPHALGYFLSESYGVAHGTACAVYLPAFMHHNEYVAKDLTQRFLSSLSTDIEGFCSLVKELTPEINVTVTPTQREALAPRWVNNGSLKKSLGDITPQFVDELLKELF